MASVRLHGVSVMGRRSADSERRGWRRREPPLDPILHDVCLDVADGEFVMIAGASGSGKSTVLRTIAGLEVVTGGRVEIGDVDVTGTGPAERDVAMVFQQASLLPNRDVQRNVAFPLEVRARSADEIRLRVLAESRALHIEALLARSPQHLSVGERQLVQIARALVRVPSVLLLDEPLARLDAWTSQRMRSELRVLQRGYTVTTVMTTNDPLEAMSMPDRLVVIDQGRIVQVGTPLEVYREPSTMVAAALTGELTIDRVRVTASADAGFWLRGNGVPERGWCPSLGRYVGAVVLRGVRPDGTVLFFDPVTEACIV